MNIGLVLLNFNEIEAISKFLRQIDSHGFQKVFAVDGGSKDGSREILESHGYEVLIQNSRGRGDAFRLAFLHAEELSLDGLVFISTDGNEDPSDLPKFLKGLEAGNDLVIGSRMIRGSRNEEDDQLFRPRKTANKIFALIAYVMYGRKTKRITDPINGFRAITIQAWRKMKLDYSGYDIEFASSIKAYKLNLRVAEFPTTEMNRLGGQSGAHAIPTTIALFRVLRRMRNTSD